MGVDDLSVVDEARRVHGLESLRVVDASVMPCMITANLGAAAVMIGEKLTDAIHGRQPLPPEYAAYFRHG